MRLTNAEIEELHKAIEGAFPGVAGAARLMIALQSIDVDLMPYANPLTPLFFTLHVALVDINAQGRIADVLGAARRANTSDARLTELEKRWLRTSAAVEQTRLEGMVLDDLNYQPAPGWVDKLRAAFGSVCRVERASDGKSLGTGFVIADDLVITNYHVLYTRGANEPVPVQLRFDAITDSGGQVVSVDGSIPQPIEKSPPGGAEWGGIGEPGNGELDFAVVRLARRSGDPARGHLEIDVTAGATSTNRPFLILEHPWGAPLQICLGSITGANPARTRVHHNATTQRGSSGAPCLSMDLKVIALHNGGIGARLNTCVPIAAVEAALADRNLSIGR
jgi:hypothetical protein